MALSARQNHAIEITERIGSALSLLGASFIILTFLLDRGFHKPINRLVFYASWGNVLANAGTLISRTGIHYGDSSALCQFQAFLIQMFLPADALWTFAMACNVYLTFFHHYDAHQLRSLEWRYALFAYGTPLVPAFVYFFVHSAEKGKVYGSAVLWCWVSIKWDVLRVATFYGPVWLVIMITCSIYVWAGKEIFEKRRQLRRFAPFQQHRGRPLIENPFTAPALSSKTVEIHITSELAPTMNSSEGSLSSSQRQSGAAKGHKCYDAYSVTIGAGHPSLSLADKDLPPASPYRPDRAYNSAATVTMEANRAAFNYTKCAALFFLSLLVTWVPSTVNRVYSLVHPDAVNFPLLYVSSLVLPLQGFWNAVVYIVTSYDACTSLYRRIRPMRSPDERVSRSHSFSPPSRQGRENHRPSESSSESLRGLATTGTNMRDWT